MTTPKTIAEARKAISGCSFPDCIYCVEASEVIVAIAQRDAYAKAEKVARAGGCSCSHANCDHDEAGRVIARKISTLAAVKPFGASEGS
jgi:hypothetical protein